MLDPTPANLLLLSRLRLRWNILAVISLACWGAGYIFLRYTWQPEYAIRWLLLSGLGLSYLLRISWLALPHNQRSGELEMLPTLGIGNCLTYLRGLFIAALAGFLLSPWPQGWLGWVPGLLYTIAALMDFMDGYLARLTNHTTRMGEILDINVDGMGVLVATFLIVQYQQVPWWYIFIGLARYLYLGGLWLRMRLGKTNAELPPSHSRRGIAGLQMGFTFVMLLPIFTPPGTTIVAGLFAIPFLGGFLKDWLIVCGMLKPESPTLAKTARFTTHWLPVFLRLALVILMAWQLLLRFLGRPERLTSLETTPITSLGLMLLSAIELMVLLMILLGAAGRIAAMMGLLLAGFEYLVFGLTPQLIMIAIIATALLYLGTGGYSLWKPEDRLIYRRAGERLPTAIAVPTRAIGPVYGGNPEYASENS